MARADDPDPAAESVEPPARQEENSVPAERSTVEEDAQASDTPSTEAAATSAQTESEEIEPADEEPAEGLTDVPGVVLADADVRVRPGLAWPTVDRVAAGESVLVLYGGGGWYRISYGDGLEGWIRSTAVDLGEIDERSVLRQTAPAILAEWRGVEYGVMGQSADGAEVRLLAIDDEQSKILGAPKDEVSLLASDITIDDLPVLIGDETVVFPGDDFQAGQGKILPKANEWMWLPWGWLLAHNDEYIWQWRPETDQLEFVRRPPGLATLSPDGRHLAIDHLCLPAGPDCDEGHYALILPLNGSAPVSLLAQVRNHGLTADSVWNSNWFLAPEWAPNSQAVAFSVFVPGREYVVPTSIILHVDGRVAVFDQLGSHVLGDLDCVMTLPYPGGYDNPWELRGDSTIAAPGSCTDASGESRGGELVFSLDGEFLGVSDSTWSWERSEGADLFRTATGGGDLSERLLTSWSYGDKHALFVDLVAGDFWTYDAVHHEIRIVEFESSDPVQSRLASLLKDYRDDLDSIDIEAVWCEGRVSAVIRWRWFIAALILVDTATSEGIHVDIGGRAWHRGLRDNYGWNHDGTMNHFASDSFDLTDGLAMRAWNSSHLIVVDRDGNHLGLVNIANTCRDPASEGVLRHRAAWSSDGKWLAIGGQNLGGVFACPDWLE